MTGVKNATIAFHTVSHTALIPFQMVTNTAATTMKQFLMNSPIGMMTFCTYAWMKPQTASNTVLTPFHTVFHTEDTPSQMPVKKLEMPPHTDCATELIPSHNPEKKLESPSQTALPTSQIFCHASPSHDVNAAHALRPTSVWVKNQTSAATTAAMAVIIAPMGLAAMIALNAPCTAVAALVAALHAVCAFLTMLSCPPICLSICTGPPRSIMSWMPLLTPFAAPVTVSIVPLSTCNPLLRA